MEEVPLFPPFNSTSTWPQCWRWGSMGPISHTTLDRTTWREGNSNVYFQIAFQIATAHIPELFVSIYVSKPLQTLNHNQDTSLVYYLDLQSQAAWIIMNGSPGKFIHITQYHIKCLLWLYRPTTGKEKLPKKQHEEKTKTWKWQFNERNNQPWVKTQPPLQW